MKKLKASKVWGENPVVVSACEDCAKRNDMDCKFAALNKVERGAVVVSCKHKVKRGECMGKGFVLIEVMIASAVLAILVATVMPLVGNWAVPSRGTRSGIITKLSQKGLIWKTYEGAMMIGSGNSGEMWDFSIGLSDPDGGKIVGILLKKMGDGKPVEVDYEQKLFTWKKEAGTSYLIKAVKSE